MKSVAHYGLLVYGCISKTHSKPICSLQEKIRNLIYSQSRRLSTEELFESSEVRSMKVLHTVELLIFVIFATHGKCPTGTFFSEKKSRAILKTRSIETKFYEILFGNSVKLNISLKHRGARHLNHLRGRNFSFVGRKRNSQVSINLGKYIEKLVVGHKLSEVVSGIKPYYSKSNVVKLLNLSVCNSLMSLRVIEVFGVQDGSLQHLLYGLSEK